MASGGLESGGCQSSPRPQCVESIAVLATEVQAGGAPGTGRNARPHPDPLPPGRGRVFGSVIRCLGASDWRTIVMRNGPRTARPQMAREYSGIKARVNFSPRRERVGAGCPLWPRRERAGFPESGCGFVLYDVDGEWLMPLDCPEFSRGGGGRKGGVKALPMHRERSPRPGGLRGGHEHDEEPWGLRRGAIKAGGRWRAYEKLRNNQNGV